VDVVHHIPHFIPIPTLCNAALGVVVVVEVFLGFSTKVTHSLQPQRMRAKSRRDAYHDGP
jgi:hypothetical protein